MLVARRDTFPLVITLLALAFLGLFLLYPLFNVFGASFLDRTGKSLTLANYARMLSSSFYLGSLYNTLVVGVAATVITIVIGVPLAFCLARLPIPGKSALLALASLPLVLPSFVAAYALVLLLGRAGIVTQWLREVGIPFTSIYGLTGVTVVFALSFFPFVVIPAFAAFKAVDISVEEAGQNLGASRWRTFWTVTVPIVMPAVLAGGLLVFIDAIESFGVPFVLAEDKPFLAVEAYKLFVGELGGNPASAACAEGGSGPPVPEEAKDIAPCPSKGDPNNMGDAFINVSDVLATLDVFAGIPQACDTCDGAPPAIVLGGY